MMTAGDNGTRTTVRQREVFDALVQRSRQQVYSRAYRLLRNQADAEDVTQEAFIKAWCRFPQFDGRNWDAWLHRIVTNAALSRLELLKRSQRVFASEPTDTEAGDDLLARLPANGAEQPERQVIAREGRERLQAAIDTLPAEWATLIRLYALDDYSCDQIAALMDWPPGTVRSRIHRARARLRAVLMDEVVNGEA